MEQPLQLTTQHLDDGFEWSCKQRLHYPANADIWLFRARWQELKHRLLSDINAGSYRFSPLQKICKKNRQIVHVWSACDALVIKVLTQLLQSQLKLSERCTHLKGHLGLKQTVCDVQAKLPDYTYVCKTDVKDFYASIDQYILLNLLADHVSHRLLRRYCYQIVHRTLECGGEFTEIEQGISRGCALSPLLGALYLTQLDELMSRQPNVYYVRYMDDILLFTKTRWHNRRVIQLLNQQFNELKIKQHPNKTFIGKIERGFDFLGYHFSRQPLTLAAKTVSRHVERWHRLYEQQRSNIANSEELARSWGDTFNAG